jgi:hypothetical protein
MPNIASKSNRRCKTQLPPFLYRNSDAIGNVFRRPKDYRWILLTAARLVIRHPMIPLQKKLKHDRVRSILPRP